MRDPRPALISGGFAILLLAAGWAWHPQPASCTSIMVASSNEKYGTLSALAAEYSRGQTTSGGCAAVTVEKVPSGDAQRRLGAGWTGPDRPDVWAPAATTWVVLLRQQLGPNQHLLPDYNASIAKSPLVIGMPMPMAEALGWPRTQPSWLDLLSLSQEPDGWGHLGHPEWGLFRLGQTDPRFSTSGLHALIASYWAATGRSTELVASDITNSQGEAFVRAEEASVAHYSDTAENFLRTLKAADDANYALGYVSAVTLEEQELWQYNRGQIGEDRPVTPPRVQLAAIYPKDGTLIADHPYVVLNGIGSAKARLADDFLAWLLRPAQQKGFAKAGFRDPQDNQTNAGYGILANEPSRLIGSPAPTVISLIQQSWQKLRKRARVLVVVDASTPLIRSEVASAIGQLAADDQVGVWAVGPAETSPPYREVQPIAEVGADPTALQARVRRITAETGSPPLLAGIEAAFAYLKANTDPKRIDAVLVVAGGANDASRGPDLPTLLTEVRSDPLGSVTRVFGVSTAPVNDTLMVRIAQASGGVAFTAHNDAAVSAALQRLVAEF